MALTNGELSAADIAAVTGSNNGNNSGWGNGDGAWWLIVLFLFAFAGGWGNNRGGGGNGGYGGSDGSTNVYFSNELQRGFDQSAVMAALGGISNSLANAEVSRCNAQANILQTLNNNHNSLSSQLVQMLMNQQECCCENRLGLANLNSVILSENCADRAALSDGVRDIITSQNSGVQRILDQMCNDKIDAKNERIADLERQLTMANLAASQTAQTSRILADNANQTLTLEQYLNPTPIPAYIVQNPNGCNCGNYNNNCGCGCGCGSNF